MDSHILLLGAIVLFFGEIGVSFCAHAEYNQKEKEALDKFRPLVENVLVADYQREDNFLMRWLRVQNFNIDAAVRMLQEAQKWRKENDIDTILNETILEFPEKPYSIDGYDNDGSPVIIFSPTRLDPRKYLRGGQFAKVVRYWDQILEEGATKLRAAQAAAINSTTDNEITQVVSILDLQGFNIRQHLCLDCIRLYVAWTIHFEKYHPDSVKYFIMINTPRVAVPMVEIIRPLFSPITRKGFLVFGPDKKEWSSFLLSIIPADQLTYQYGGTKKN